MGYFALCAYYITGRPMMKDETVEVSDSGILRPGEQRNVSLKTSLVSIHISDLWNSGS